MLDKPAVIGNMDDFNQLIYYGSYYFKNKHLKQSFSSSLYKYNFSYDFDSNGKIVSVYSFDGKTTETFRFTYECK